jgi:hypothetical protein
MATGSDITAVDYNAIRTKIVEILGTGSAQKGYGQPFVSSQVLSGNDITAEQWSELRYDIYTVKYHQDGEPPSIIQVNTGDVIRYGAGHPNTNYNTITDQAVEDKFDIGTGQFTITSKGSESRTGSWNTQSQCTVTVSFTNNDQARYFFNSGGKIRFFSSRTGGTVGLQQNNAWTSLLTSADVVSFGAVTPAIVNFYSLTTSYQQVYLLGSSSPYSANFYKIEALCNTAEATNVNGTADEITFRITWGDSYTDPGPGGPPFEGDNVDGTLSLQVEELRATGPLFPTGTFNISSPSVSVSSITAS